jgi:hypothetical protein
VFPFLVNVENSVIFLLVLSLISGKIVYRQNLFVVQVNLVLMILSIKWMDNLLCLYLILIINHKVLHIHRNYVFLSSWGITLAHFS